MPAPKGNDYGKDFWMKSSIAKPGEKSQRISTRLSKSEVEEIKQQLQEGETIGSWLRERAREGLAANRN
ncbi:MAG: hypothetical protein AB4426_13990 [Xenococcaceae cyanobacterium]